MARRPTVLNLSLDLFNRGAQSRLQTSCQRHASDVVQSSTSSRFTRSPRPARWSAVDAQIRQLKNLPSELQQSAWVDLLDREVLQKLPDDPARPPKYQHKWSEQDVLPLTVHILEYARTVEKTDVLARAAKDSENWLVIDPVIKLLLGGCQSSHNYREEHKEIPGWRMIGSFNSVDLDEFTGRAIPADAISFQRTTATDLQKLENTLSIRHEPSLSARTTSQILQSLGDMVIEAAEYSGEDKTHQTLMTAFVDCLAQLHHNDVIPSSIYNYDAPCDSTVIKRPPLLQSFWARIMTHLTHVSWNKSWIGTMAEAAAVGVDLPPPRHQYPGEPVGTEVWLEFLLWTCIEGGWIDEAASIITRLENFPSHNRKPWSVITWDDVCKMKPPEMSWRTALRISLGSPEGTFPTHKMGPRTISFEVIQAIMDGIANTTSSVNTASKKLFQSNMESFRACQALISRSGYNLDAERGNGLVLRLVEGASLSDAVASERLDDILHISPTLKNAEEPNETHQISVEQGDTDPSASILGLLHRNLEALALQSDEQGVLKTLGSILNIIDANRNLYIRLFAATLRQRSNVDDKFLGEERRATPLLHPQVSLHALEEVLDFVTRNKLVDIGDFLFHNDEIDEGFIQANVFAKREMQPQLIQYAVDNSDSVVLARVIEQIQPPISPKILHAFIRYRMLTHRWQEVEDIFRQLSFSKDATWTPKDVFAIAAYVVRHLGSENDQEQANVEHAYRILDDVLRGYYDALPDPSQSPEIGTIQKANQIKRILRTVPGGVFSSLSSVSNREAGPLSNPRLVSDTAFNLLLEAIVEKHGSRAGRDFHDRWCLERNDIDFVKQILYQNTLATLERVVKPSALLVRSVVAPLLVQPTPPKRRSQDFQVLRSSGSEARLRSAESAADISQDELLILRWAIDKYEKLGEDGSRLAKKLPKMRALARDRNE